MSDYGTQQELPNEQPEEELEVKSTAEYVAFANHIRNSAIISLVLQVVICIALIIWLGYYSVLAFLPAIAIFQIAKVATRWSRKQKYTVNVYYDGQLWNSYDTNGGIIGGLIVTVIVVVAFLLALNWLQSNFLPVGSIAPWLLIVVCMVWLIAFSAIADIQNLRLARTIHRMAASYSMFGHNRPIAELIATWHEKSADFKIKIHITMICSMIAILAVQFVVSAIQAPFITAKLDHHEVYHRYLESDFADEDLLPLTEEWFEEALKQKNATDYAKLWTNLTLNAEASMDFNGITRDVEMHIVYRYHDARWDVSSCSIKSSRITSINVSGVWEGTGKDRNLKVQSDQVHMKLTIRSLTDTQVEGTLESIPPEGQGYCKDFVGEVKEKNGKYSVNGKFVSDSKRIEFIYDPHTDTIDDMSWSWVITLTRAE